MAGYEAACIMIPLAFMHVRKLPVAQLLGSGYIYSVVVSAVLKTSAGRFFQTLNAAHLYTVLR